MLNTYDSYFSHPSGRLKAHIWQGNVGPYYTSIWRQKPDGTRGRLVENLKGQPTPIAATLSATAFMDQWVAAYLIKHPPKGT